MKTLEPHVKPQEFPGKGRDIETDLLAAAKMDTCYIQFTKFARFTIIRILLNDTVVPW